MKVIGICNPTPSTYKKNERCATRFVYITISLRHLGTTHVSEFLFQQARLIFS